MAAELEEMRDAEAYDPRVAVGQLSLVCTILADHIEAGLEGPEGPPG